MAVQIPDPSARLSLEDGRPSQAWYGILSKLARLLNSTEATVGDASSGLGSKLSQGRHTIWVPAAAMVAGATTGPTSTYTEMSNGNRLQTLDFDQSTQETAWFQISMPKSWDRAALPFEVHWTAASGSGSVVWQFGGAAVSDGDTLDFSSVFSYSQADTFLGANLAHVSPLNSAGPVAGSAADKDLICFRVRRVTGDASDTLTADAKLIGVKIFYTINAGNDA